MLTSMRVAIIGQGYVGPSFTSFLRDIRDVLKISIEDIIRRYPQLKKDYLDTGLAKIEFRHFPLDIAAFNASKVSQCKNDGDSKILNSLFANQQKWVKGSSAEEANKNLEKFLKNECCTN